MTLLHQAAQKAVEAPTDALAEMTARKDSAYEERNKVVAALAKVFPSGIARTAIEGWSEDWHGCVYIDLPTGQVSWHFHDSQAHLFDGLPPYTKPWDGHDTPEKYRRLSALQHQEVPSTAVIPPAPPECETEDEKTAFAFGYWQGLHAARKGQEVPREPVLPHTPLLEQALSAMADVQEQAEPGFEPDVAIIPASDWRVFVDAHAELSMLWTTWRDSPGWAPLDDPAASPSTTRQQGLPVGGYPQRWQFPGVPVEPQPPEPTTRQQEVGSRKQLTEEQIILATEHISMERPGVFVYVARAIERAHGIGVAAAPSTPENAGGVEGKCECGLSEAACRDPLRRSCPDGVQEVHRG